MTDEYKTIKETSEGYYTEKRSKFLAFAHSVSTVDEVKDIVAQYRKKYYDARHVCYAYMLGAERTEFRANDDGEPWAPAVLLLPTERLPLTPSAMLPSRRDRSKNSSTIPLPTPR